MKVSELAKKDSPVLLVGGLIGAGVALMFAPWSGRETRKNIGNMAGDIKGKAREYMQDGRGKVMSLAEKGKVYYKETKTRVTSPIGACADAYSKEKERLARKH